MKGGVTPFSCLSACPFRKVLPTHFSSPAVRPIPSYLCVHSPAACRLVTPIISHAACGHWQAFEIDPSLVFSKWNAISMTPAIRLSLWASLYLYFSSVCGHHPLIHFSWSPPHWVSKPECKDAFACLCQMDPIFPQKSFFLQEDPMVISAKVLPETPAVQPGVVLKDNIHSYLSLCSWLTWLKRTALGPCSPP